VDVFQRITNIRIHKGHKSKLQTERSIKSSINYKNNTQQT